MTDLETIKLVADEIDRLAFEAALHPEMTREALRMIMARATVIRRHVRDLQHQAAGGLTVRQEPLDATGPELVGGRGKVKTICYGPPIRITGMRGIPGTIRPFKPTV